jgi:hypothetical protein
VTINTFKGEEGSKVRGKVVFPNSSGPPFAAALLYKDSLTLVNNK